MNPSQRKWEGPASSGPHMGSEPITLKKPLIHGRDEARPSRKRHTILKTALPNYQLTTIN